MDIGQGKVDDKELVEEVVDQVVQSQGECGPNYYIT